MESDVTLDKLIGFMAEAAVVIAFGWVIVAGLIAPMLVAVADAVFGRRKP